MKVVKSSEEVDQLILQLTSKEFLGLQPILAGGFVAWLYQLETNSQEQIPEIITAYKNMKKIRETASIAGVNLNIITTVKYDFLSNYPYYDIDAWFKNTNDVWDINNPESVLITAEGERDLLKEMAIKIGFQDVKHQSLWANTLSRRIRSDNHEDKLQIIIRPYSSTEEILSSFDLDGCKIGWENGFFHLTDEFLESIQNRRIIINDNNWKSSEHFQRVQTALRAFKYHKRMGWPLSKDSLNKIFEVYQEVFSHKKYKVSVVKTTSLITKVSTGISSVLSKILPKMSPHMAHQISIYGQNKSVDVLKDFQMKLLDSFEIIVVQPDFESSMLPYFIGTGNYKIEKLVLAMMECESNNNSSTSKI